MNDDIPLTFTKEALVKTLKAKLKEAEKRDAAALREHKKAEQQHLMRFRTALRDMLTWDYDRAKAENFTFDSGWDSGKRRERPECPPDTASSIRRALALIEMSEAKKFLLHPTREYAFLYRVVTTDIEKAKAVC